MVRIVDIAEAAGVSAATVSLVLNDKGNISPATRRKVHEALCQLNYTRTGTRRGRKSASSFRGRLIMLSLNSNQLTREPEHHPYLMHLLNHLTRAGYEVIYRPCLNIEDVRSVRAEGFSMAICNAPNLRQEWLSELANSGVRVLQFGYSTGNIDYPGVLVDNFNGSLQATRYLLNKGHKRIGIVRIDKDSPNHKYNSVEKMGGFLAALAEQGQVFDPRYEADGRFHGPDRAFTVTTRLLSMEEPPTALFVDNDWGSENVLQAIRGIGRNVEVVQFGDTGMNNLLPTMTIWWLEMADVAKRMIQGLMDGTLLDQPIVRILPHMEVVE